MRLDLMEGFVKSLLEFVIVSGLFYQPISLSSNLCIYGSL